MRFWKYRLRFSKMYKVKSIYILLRMNIFVCLTKNKKHLSDIHKTGQFTITRNDAKQQFFDIEKNISIRKIIFLTV